MFDIRDIILFMLRKDSDSTGFIDSTYILYFKSYTYTSPLLFVARTAS
ncbi:hypothetical protein VCHA52P453_50158 [Vibrio chagasii]|nr:hypothetical protein VCHA48P434_40108 [Vibrio chagasii]CAH7334125.1 hypothetical protein VCHA39P226_50062 [Vibrio chagasii]CAH7370061.1 hypothetical protein VCHA52P453_50158 [Vibrio chagasii]CAH7394305.1 hypothetical protein VCHA52P456_70059 [Vibrio chagasii]